MKLLYPLLLCSILPAQASFQTYGQGCGSIKPPTLHALSKPAPGRFVVEARGFLPRPTHVVMMLGQASTPGLDLRAMGAPGCSLLVTAPFVLVPMPKTPTGTYVLVARIPASEAGSGNVYAGQAFAADPKANPAGLSCSNAFQMLVGTDTGS